MPLLPVSFKPATDPFLWDINDELHDYVATYGLTSQNKASRYPESVRDYPDCSRYMSNSVFECVQRNVQKTVIEEM